MTDIKSTRVNGARLWDSIMEMAEIGPGEHGGSRRLALTDEDRDGRDLFVGWCKEMGCSIDIDDMGNIFARRDGRNNDLPPIVAGSHLDTQPHGGKFDGIYGVLSALEAIRTLHDNDIVTEAPGRSSGLDQRRRLPFRPGNDRLRGLCRLVQKRRRLGDSR